MVRVMGVETWEDVLRLRPASVRPATLGWAWTRERLWAREFPLETLRVAAFAWLLELPMWRHDGRPFTLRPIEVLKHPADFPEHARRDRQSNLRYPLHVTRWHGRWIILDGLHRLVKAMALGLEDLQVFNVPPERYAEFGPADQ
jgi:hypothetical protein